MGGIRKVLSALTVVSLLGTACGAGAERPDPGSGTPRTGTVDTPAPHDLGDRLVAEIPVGRGPAGMAVGFDSVWVENHRGASISRIDAATNRVVVEIPAGTDTCGVVAADDGIWIPSSDALRRIDPATNRVSLNVELSSCGVALAGGRAWSVRGDGVLHSIDPRTGEVERHGVRIGKEAYITQGEGGVFAIDNEAQVIRVDPETGKLTKRARLSETKPVWYDLSFGHGKVWVSLTGEVLRLDPETLKVEERLDLGTQPLWFSAGPGAMWVTASNRNQIYKITPEAVEVTDRLDVGDYPLMLVEAFGDGWVSSLENNTVYRIRLPGS